MANRVVIGNRNGQYGLWVSKPGYDVLTTSSSNLLFDMSGSVLQIIQSGEFSVSGTTNIPLSNTGGITPLVIVWSKVQTYYGSTIQSFPDKFNVNVTATTLTISLASGFSGTHTGTYIVFGESV